MRHNSWQENKNTAASAFSFFFLTDKIIAFSLVKERVNKERADLYRKHEEQQSPHKNKTKKTSLLFQHQIAHRFLPVVRQVVDMLQM